MNKERREELRAALAKEDLPGWKTEFILHIDDPQVGMYLEEIRALLDSDERLEAVREWAERPAVGCEGGMDCHYDWAQAEVLEILNDGAAEGHNRIKTVANAENEQPGEWR